MENKSDHDLLIKLDSNFQTFLKQYHIDMKELKDGTALKLADLESRMRGMESLRDTINPQKMATELEAVLDWKNEFVIRWKTILALSVGLSSLITFLLTVIAFVLDLIK